MKRHMKEKNKGGKRKKKKPPTEKKIGPRKEKRKNFFFFFFFLFWGGVEGGAQRGGGGPFLFFLRDESGTATKSHTPTLLPRNSKKLPEKGLCLPIFFPPSEDALKSIKKSGKKPGLSLAGRIKKKNTPTNILLSRTGQKTRRGGEGALEKKKILPLPVPPWEKSRKKGEGEGREDSPSPPKKRKEGKKEKKGIP